MAMVLSALFIATALLAAATMMAAWRRFGRQALALRAELAACEDERALRYAIRETRVAATATVLRPNFTPRTFRPALPAVA
jgi:hypothetical protein